MINFNKNIPNDNQNKQKYFKENLTENNSLVNNTINEFKEKKDIINLEPGKEFKTSFSAEFF